MQLLVAKAATVAKATEARASQPLAAKAATAAKARASQPLAAKAGAAKANRICFSLVVFGSAIRARATPKASCWWHLHGRIREFMPSWGPWGLCGLFHFR